MRKMKAFLGKNLEREEKIFWMIIKKPEGKNTSVGANWCFRIKKKIIEDTIWYFKDFA